MKEVKLEGIIYRYDPRESAMSFDFPDPNDVNGSERRRDFVLTIEDGIDNFNEMCLEIAKHKDFIRFENPEFQKRYMDLYYERTN